MADKLAANAAAGKEKQRSSVDWARRGVDEGWREAMNSDHLLQETCNLDASEHI